MKSRRQWYHRDMLSYLPYILHQANTDKGHVQCICANNHRVAEPRCLKPFISFCYRRTQLSLVFLSLQIYKQTTIVVPYHVLPWQHRISKQVGYPPDPAHNYIHPGRQRQSAFCHSSPQWQGLRYLLGIFPSRGLHPH